MEEHRATERIAGLAFVEAGVTGADWDPTAGVEDVLQELGEDESSEHDPQRSKKNLVECR
jgi:hypothetical protein